MLEQFIKLFYEYSLSIIPTFLFALFLSAVLSEALPEHFFEHFGIKGNRLLSAIWASILGALIPLCTCGMIPLASKLHKKGIPWLIVISFLTAGNSSSIASIFMTFVVGLKITFLRVLVAVLFGIVVAYVFVAFFKPHETVLSTGTRHHHENQTLQKKIISEFNKLFIDFSPWVLVAIFFASCISLYLKPEDILNFVGEKNILSPFLLSLAGFPFYFCGGADIPISKALLDKGLEMGSVLAFMTASPGVNLISFFVYQKWLGIKNSLAYLFISVLVCGFLGLVINLLL